MYCCRRGDLALSGSASSVWVPGNFESMFIKAGNSETKDRIKIEEVTGENLGWAALAL